MTRALGEDAIRNEIFIAFQLYEYQANDSKFFSSACLSRRAFARRSVPKQSGSLRVWRSHRKAAGALFGPHGLVRLGTARRALGNLWRVNAFCKRSPHNKNNSGGTLLRVPETPLFERLIARAGFSFWGAQPSEHAIA